jgi:hypothetical protein
VNVHVVNGGLPISAKCADGRAATHGKAAAQGPRTMKHMSSFLLASSLLAACATTGGPDGSDESFLTGGIAEGTPEARAVLRVANGASYTTLHDLAGLYAPATNHILAFRAGVDGVSGTADDRVIKTLAELDAIPYVGPASYDELVAYATTRTWQQQLPAHFSYTLVVPTPVSATTWTSIAQGGPYSPTTQTAKTLNVSLTIHDQNGFIRVEPSPATGQVATLDANGVFTLASSSSGITTDQRNIWFDRKTISGRVNALGEVVITTYSARSGSGNSIYGYRGTSADLTGDAHVALPYVDPAP